MLYIDYSGAEFGSTISTGLWLPYIYRNTGQKVGVYTKIPFPKEWVLDKWFDDYIPMETPLHGINKGRSTETLLVDRHRIQNLVVRDRFIPIVPNSAIHSMPLPDFKRKTKEKYVVIVPNVYEHMLERKGQITHAWRWRHSLSFKNWMKISKLLRKHKIRIIGFGCSSSCSEDHLKSMSDEYYFFTAKSVRVKNNIFVEQLKWMKNALCTIAFGGAMHPHFVFKGLSIIGYDKKIERIYSYLIKQAKTERNDLHFIQDPEMYIHQNDLLNFSSKHLHRYRIMSRKESFQANNFVRDLVIKKIKEVIL